MMIRFMKYDAIRFFKDNLETYYTNYFTKNDNSWMTEVYGSDPFEDFMEVEDFELANPDAYDRYERGEMDIENCKIVFSNLCSISESQAADERLWAGLCNDAFYLYMKRRWNNYELQSKAKDLGEIRKRFFFLGKTRSGLYGNTLARAWWIGHDTYDVERDEPFELLDMIGGTDFSTKLSALFSSYTFSANKNILKGIIEAIYEFNRNDIPVIVKKDLRPALKYLNAYGGSILLDYLSSEEIKNIVLKKMIEMKKGKLGVLNYDIEDSTEENIEDPDEELDISDSGENQGGFIDELLKSASSADDEPEYVEYSDTVKIRRIKDGSEFEYEIPADKEGLDAVGVPHIVPELLGLRTGESFSFHLDRYEITELNKNA